MSSARNRLMLYSLLTSMEQDLRSAINDHILPNLEFTNLFNAESIGKLTDRCKKDGGDEFEPRNLIDYCDLADTLHVVNKHGGFLGQAVTKFFKSEFKNLNF